MGKKRQSGERSDNIITFVDMELFKILSNHKEGFGVLELKPILNISNGNVRRHLNRLEELKLITKTKVSGSNKRIIQITENGTQIYKILNSQQ